MTSLWQISRKTVLQRAVTCRHRSLVFLRCSSLLPAESRRRHCSAPVGCCRTAQFSSGAGMKKISRTSTGIRPTFAPLRAHSSASSRSAVSSIDKPPTCSLVSRYGPSVRSTSPLGCARSVWGLPRPQANFLTPAAIISLLSAWIPC